MKPNEPHSQDHADESVNGIPYRLLDGYDGSGQQPSAEEITQLLKHAPPEVLARIAAFSKLREHSDQSLANKQDSMP